MQCTPSLGFANYKSCGKKGTAVRRLPATILTTNSELLLNSVFASDDEERLMMDVFRGYNSLIQVSFYRISDQYRQVHGFSLQPTRNASDMPIIVKVALQLVLLINVDEKNQVMHTNVWLTLKWHDFQMRWNPVNYGEIKEIRVTPDKVWLPDIVLFNKWVIRLLRYLYAFHHLNGF
ncbi:hypothetical protein COOONC_25609 [Cooperia oncophora]